MERYLECPVCDTAMVRVDEGGPKEWMCIICGNRAFEEVKDGKSLIYFERVPEDDYEEYYDPEDYDMPDGDL